MYDEVSEIEFQEECFASRGKHDTRLGDGIAILLFGVLLFGVFYGCWWGGLMLIGIPLLAYGIGYIRPYLWTWPAEKMSEKEMRNLRKRYPELTIKTKKKRKVVV